MNPEAKEIHDRIQQCSADASYETLREILNILEMLNHRISAIERLTADEAKRAEVERLNAELSEIKKVLSDPAAVHANLLRGTIACPSIESLRHLIGDSELQAKRKEVDLSRPSAHPGGCCCLQCAATIKSDQEREP